jgi:Ribbon-helix-helix protein, copG family
LLKIPVLAPTGKGVIVTGSTYSSVAKSGAINEAPPRQPKATWGCLAEMCRSLPMRAANLTYVDRASKLTYMEKTQVYLRKEELDALRQAAARSGRSIAELVRDAIRKVVLKPRAAGLVAIWDGEPRRSSMEHDSVHDEP